MHYRAQLKFTVSMPATSMAKDTVPHNLNILESVQGDEENVFYEMFFKLLYLESKGTQVLLKTIDL